MRSSKKKPFPAELGKYPVGSRLELPGWETPEDHCPGPCEGIATWRPEKKHGGAKKTWCGWMQL